MKILQELIDFLKKTSRIAVLTGAGISAESGLKTFRDSQDGHWSKYRPEDLATPQAFERDPKLVWDWYAMRRGKAAEASPNSGHFALVEMERHLEHFTSSPKMWMAITSKPGAKMCLSYTAIFSVSNAMMVVVLWIVGKKQMTSPAAPNATPTYAPM